MPSSQNVEGDCPAVPPEGGDGFDLSANYIFLWAYYRLKPIFDNAYHDYFHQKYLKCAKSELNERCEELALTSLSMNMRLREDNCIWERRGGKNCVLVGAEAHDEFNFIDHLDLTTLGSADGVDPAEVRAKVRRWVEEATEKKKRALTDLIYKACQDKYWFFVILTYNSKTDYIEAWLPPKGWEKKYPGIISPVQDARRYLDRYKNPLGIGTSSAVILTGEPECLPNELEDPRGRWRDTDVALCKRACIHLPMIARRGDVQGSEDDDEHDIALGTFGVYSYFVEAFEAVWRDRREEIKQVIEDTSHLLYYADAAEVRNQFFRTYYAVRDKSFEQQVRLFDEGFVRNDKLLGSQICATYKDLSPTLLKCEDVQVSMEAVQTYLTSLLYGDPSYYDQMPVAGKEATYTLEGPAEILEGEKVQKFLDAFAHFAFGEPAREPIPTVAREDYTWYVMAPNSREILEEIDATSPDGCDEKLFAALLTLAFDQKKMSDELQADLTGPGRESLAALRRKEPNFPYLHSWVRGATSHEKVLGTVLPDNFGQLEWFETYLADEIKYQKKQFEEAIIKSRGVNLAAMDLGMKAFDFSKKLNGVVNTIERLKLKETLLKAIYPEVRALPVERAGEIVGERRRFITAQALLEAGESSWPLTDVDDAAGERLWDAFNRVLALDPLLLAVTKRRKRHRMSALTVECEGADEVLEALRNMRFYSQAQNRVNKYASDKGPGAFKFERYEKSEAEIIKSATLSKDGDNVLMTCVSRDDSVCATVTWSPLEREEVVGCYVKWGIQAHERVKGVVEIRADGEQAKPGCEVFDIDSCLPINKHVRNLLGVRKGNGQYLRFVIDSPEKVKMFSVKNKDFTATRRLRDSFYAASSNILKGRLKGYEIDIYVRLLWKLGCGPGSKHEDDILRLAKLVRRSGAGDKVHIVLQGETGTGKEVVAKFIHQHSTRGGAHFLSHNCAAIPDSLFEGLMFGYVPGAFTDAKIFSDGVFIRGHDGTLFLDEIGDLSLFQQAKILKALEENAVYRLGDFVPVPINVRVVAATNRNIRGMVKVFEDKSTANSITPAFRPDLFFRLQYLVELPALRERSKVGRWFLLVNIFPEIVRLMSVDSDKACRFIGSLKVMMEDEFTRGNIRGWRSALRYMLAFDEPNPDKLQSWSDAESSGDGEKDSENYFLNRILSGFRGFGLGLADEDVNAASTDPELLKLAGAISGLRHSKKQNDYKEPLREFLTKLLEKKGGKILREDLKPYFDDPKPLVERPIIKPWSFLKRAVKGKPELGYEAGEGLHKSD